MAQSNMQKYPYKIVISGVREVLSLLERFGEKMKDKYIWTHTEMEQAIGYLIYFRGVLKEDLEKQSEYRNIFGESGEFFQIKHYKKGFNMKSITFKTIINHDVKKWVLKIGHRISPVVDFGDPSTEEYYKLHLKNLEILRKKVSQIKELSHLLPNPLEIMWAILNEEGELSATTLILQPFLHVVNPKKVKKKLSEEQRKHLIQEFVAFRKLCSYLLEDHKIEPDLLGEGNLEIVEKDGEYHLMLLDTGFVNIEAPIPITHTFMHIASLQTLYNVENLIRKIL